MSAYNEKGAKFEIYAHMTALAKRGMAVLMISSELPELIGMCDRIIIMKDGKNSGEELLRDPSMTENDLISKMI